MVIQDIYQYCNFKVSVFIIIDHNRFQKWDFRINWNIPHYFNIDYLLNFVWVKQKKYEP